MIRVLHVPFCYYPDAVGGTEVYVASLAHALVAAGTACVIAAPARQSASYMHDGLRVRRFAFNPQITDLSELYGEGDIRAAEEFAAVLDEELPDIVHLHAFGRDVSLRLMRAGHARNIPVIFTYHTPTVSCQRGTLLRWGNQVCDGALDLTRCTACTLHSLGMPRPIAKAVARTPVRVGAVLETARRSGGMWTALRLRELMRRRHAVIRALMREADHIIALNAWTRELLVGNGVEPEKITVIRHGLPTTGMVSPDSATGSSNGPGVRIVALGRIDPIKGFDIVIRAILSIPAARLSLDIYSVSQGAEGISRLETLKVLAGDDKRITFRSAVANAQVVSLLRGYDLLAVPSRLLETGPLVVLEAFAAGVPVIGSNLGGIAELVQHGVNGLLVEAGSVTAWSETLERIAHDVILLSRLRQGIQSPPSITLVADSTLQLYHSLKAGFGRTTYAIV